MAVNTLDCVEDPEIVLQFFPESVDRKFELHKSFVAEHLVERPGLLERDTVLRLEDIEVRLHVVEEHVRSHHHVNWSVAGEVVLPEPTVRAQSAVCNCPHFEMGLGNKHVVSILGDSAPGRSNIDQSSDDTRLRV